MTADLTYSAELHKMSKRSDRPGFSRRSVHYKARADYVTPLLNSPLRSVFRFTLSAPRHSLEPSHSLLTMRFFSLFALVTALAGVAFADDCKKTEMGCDVKGGGKRDFVELPARDVTGMTNAELLRRDLPLKSPVMRRGAFGW
jgi:hypothetical protein